jgi:hypothetical protein
MSRPLSSDIWDGNSRSEGDRLEAGRSVVDLMGEDEMSKRFFMGLMMSCTHCVASLAAAQGAPLAFSIVDRIAGGDGGYDYISVESVAHGVFVGRTTGVMKLDLRSRQATMDFVKGENVAAVLIIPGTSLMLSTNRGNNTATLFDRNSGVVKARIPTGKGPDGALYDPHSKRAFVMNGDDHSATLIDVARASVAGTIPLGGEPEAGVSDGSGHVYINIADSAEIAVVDVQSRTTVARYKMPGCEGPTGIDYDPQSKLLISACRKSQVAKLIDSVTGADRGTVAIGGGADGMIFDAARRLVYVPCNDGTLTVFRLNPSGETSGVQSVATQTGARTAALDSATGRLYLPTVQRKVDATGKAQRAPGTFQVLVVAPN